MRGTPKIVIILISIAFLISGVIFYFVQRSNQNESESNNSATPMSGEQKNMPGSENSAAAWQQNNSSSAEFLLLSMKLTSPVFQNNQMIPQKYTCDGDDINPPLEISDVPQNAKSLALIVDDPDAPGGTWVHWLIFNIGRGTVQIPENSVPPQTKEATTSFGKPGYGGPCPPSGTHHYYFKLYALDSALNLDSSAKKQDIENAMQGHIIEQTELIGLYKR